MATRQDIESEPDPRQRARLRAEACDEAVKAEPSRSTWTVGSGRDELTINLTEWSVRSGLLEVYLEVRNAQGQRIDQTFEYYSEVTDQMESALPFRYVNPPTVVEDPAGDIVRTDEDGNEVFRGRYDPLAALRAIVTDTVRRYV